MRIFTNNEAIFELLTVGKSQDKRYRSLPKSAVNGLLKVYNIMLKVDRVEDLFQHKGLNYKRLKGDLREYESVRCDSKYRLLFISSLLGNDMLITEVELIEITNHYEKL